MKIEPKKIAYDELTFYLSNFLSVFFLVFFTFTINLFLQFACDLHPDGTHDPPTSPNTIRGPSHHKSADKTDNSCRGVFYANVIGFFPVRTTCELLRLTIGFSVFFFSSCIFFIEWVTCIRKCHIRQYAKTV